MPIPSTRHVPPAPVDRSARYAVTGLFFANGLCYANVVPWLPVLKETLGLSNAALGTAVAAQPLGAVLTALLAGPMISRFGSARVAVCAGVLVAGTLPLVALSSGWTGLAVALFCLGGFDSWADAAMNTHGLRVQRRYGRSILNSFHATWSIGAMSGGLVASLMMALQVPMVAHLSGAAATISLLCLVTWRGLLPGRDDPGGATAPAATEGHRGGRGHVWRAVGLLGVLGVLLMIAGGAEDSAASWGAVYMRTEILAPALLVGMPFVATQAMMTLGRLVGDRVTDRLGPVRVTRLGLGCATAGLALALAWPHPTTAIAGFGMLGLGVAPLFPLVFAAAGTVPGVPSGYGVTVVSWLARAGFLGFPPLVGVVADHASAGLRVGLAVVPVATLVGCALAGALRPHTSARTQR